ncbi:hypothetical protein PsYK624_098660 [Phanerochaete sordida]|uniref:Secreted protein n=1 Tax=Phanerochaete sordida TaxID=48140 RepID=A0A9P3GHC7_9APHY|nr:hypothetical protein PsYK624_098660 [Phanerochaete sordida]
MRSPLMQWLLSMRLLSESLANPHHAEISVRICFKLHTIRISVPGEIGWSLPSRTTEHFTASARIMRRRRARERFVPAAPVGCSTGSSLLVIYGFQ